MTPLSLLDMIVVLIDIYSSNDGGLIEGELSCMFVGHQTLVGIGTNVDEI